MRLTLRMRSLIETDTEIKTDTETAWRLILRLGLHCLETDTDTVTYTEI